MNYERIETKKNRIVAAAHSIGFAVQHISREGTKTVITFKKPEKPLEGIGRLDPYGREEG